VLRVLLRSHQQRRRPHFPAGDAARVRRGRPLWFRRINTAELFDSLLSYVRTTVDAPGAPLPATLTAHSFSWTGGGVGPELA